MANFRTHAVFGVVTAGMLSTMTMAANVVQPHDLVTLAIAGTLGSILPDVDLQHSRASQGIFAGLGLFFAFTLLFSFSWKYSIAEMWIIWVGTFLAVRYALHNIFHKYAKHRGVFHSLLAAVFFACVTAAIQHQIFSADPTLAWLTGLFVLIGYIVHLVLDEIYSVDFNGQRVKRSFGTALKLVELKSPLGSTAVAAATVVAFLAAPTIEPFIQVVGSPTVWAMLGERLLPEESWFGFIADVQRTALLGPAQ